MSPSLRSRPNGHIRLPVLGLLLAVAALLVAPAAVAAPTSAGARGADPAATADRLTRALGAQGAGAYLDASGRLTVNVLGGEAAPVGASWGVDLASNTVLVSVPAGAGAAFVAKARSFGPAVRVERTPAVHTQAF